MHKKELIKKVNYILAQLHREGELYSHVGDQVRALEKNIVEEDLPRSLEQVELIIENSKALISAKVSCLCWDLKNAIEKEMNHD